MKNKNNEHRVDMNIYRVETKRFKKALYSMCEGSISEEQM